MSLTKRELDTVRQVFYWARGALPEGFIKGKSRKALRTDLRRISVKLEAMTAPPRDPDELTPREIEVLQALADATLMASPNDTKWVASRLGISPETVRTHLRNLSKKLGVKNRLAAVLTGRKRGLIH